MYLTMALICCTWPAFHRTSLPSSASSLLELTQTFVILRVSPHHLVLVLFFIPNILIVFAHAVCDGERLLYVSG